MGWGTCLSVSNTITIDNDSLWETAVDVVVVLQSSGHTQLQVVGQLLSSVLEHALRVVPVVQSREGGKGDAQ